MNSECGRPGDCFVWSLDLLAMIEYFGLGSAILCGQFVHGGTETRKSSHHVRSQSYCDEDIIDDTLGTKYSNHHSSYGFRSRMANWSFTLTIGSWIWWCNGISSSCSSRRTHSIVCRGARNISVRWICRCGFVQSNWNQEIGKRLLQWSRLAYASFIVCPLFWITLLPFSKISKSRTKRIDFGKVHHVNWLRPGSR